MFITLIDPPPAAQADARDAARASSAAKASKTISRPSV